MNQYLCDTNGTQMRTKVHDACIVVAAKGKRASLNVKQGKHKVRSVNHS